VETITGFAAPNALALTPNGAYLYVTNGNSSTVSVVNTATGEIVATVLVGELPTSVAVFGSTAYVTNALGYSLSEIDTATYSVVNTLVHIGIYPFSIVLTN
jgi:YVTN family beta-propeller protein